MLELRPSHFTCTLGQAAALNEGVRVPKTVNKLVDSLARDAPDAPAVAFPEPDGDAGGWHVKVYTFSEVRQHTLSAAAWARRCGESRTVALLCPSTADFLFAWLGLMRLGHAVLLVAPQCPPEAIAHLCGACSASTLLYDAAYAELARQVEAESAGIQCIELDGDLHFELPLEQQFPDAGEHDTAFVFHTSGTSSGLPKPIPQSHRAAIGVLPHSLDNSDQPIFTTTPLYHGGIADLFRAWTSRALIALFPGKNVPITAKNIIHCLDALARQSLSPRYFSSVPYILQILSANDAGLESLQSMDMIGVGGAALPQQVGDDLVGRGVRLLSRFGSAECGFLMSSHRDFEVDKDWQYLRSLNAGGFLRFEPRDEGLSELIVLPKWPHRAKTNRPDGSYATSDLFEPHPSIPNAWKYHSRADSQLTLVTGKKFDPAPLESSLAVSELLDDVLIFGNGRPYPGALLFRSARAQSLTDEELVSAISPVLDKINAKSQSHARIPLSMLVSVSGNQLQKSSKGTILRNKAEQTYGDLIEKSYSGSQQRPDVQDADVADYITRQIHQISGKPKPPELDMDLFAYGVDSLASIRIRLLLQQLVQGTSLPMSIVEDCGTVSRVAEYVVKTRTGQAVAADDELQMMRALVAEYGDFTATTAPDKPATDMAQTTHTVLLTGATGSLGAHLLHVLRASRHVSAIYLLVRGADDDAARARVDKALAHRRLPGLDAPAHARLHVVRAQLATADLGLGPQYDELKSQVTLVIHAAWAVNFRMRLRSFVKDSIAGLRHLLLLAQASRHCARVVFLSSVASVSARSGPVEETVSTDPADASPLGYGRSKWVAEGICNRAAQALPNPISILRVGQLAGATTTGVWNMAEAWPLLLAASHAMRQLPGLREELRWLPVDTAARVVAEASLQSAAPRPGPQVLHILNDTAPPDWTDLAAWAVRLAPGLEMVAPGQWLDALQALGGQGGQQAPALALVPLWERGWQGLAAGEGNAQGNGRDKGNDAPVFETRLARLAAPEASRHIRPVDEAYFAHLWAWIVTQHAKD